MQLMASRTPANQELGRTSGRCGRNQDMLTGIHGTSQAVTTIQGVPPSVVLIPHEESATVQQPWLSLVACWDHDIRWRAVDIFVFDACLHAVAGRDVVIDSPMKMIVCYHGYGVCVCYGSSSYSRFRRRHGCVWIQENCDQDILLYNRHKESAINTQFTQPIGNGFDEVANLQSYLTMLPIRTMAGPLSHAQSGREISSKPGRAVCTAESYNVKPRSPPRGLQRDPLHAVVRQRSRPSSTSLIGRTRPARGIDSSSG